VSQKKTMKSFWGEATAFFIFLIALFGTVWYDGNGNQKEKHDVDVNLWENCQFPQYDRKYRPVIRGLHIAKPWCEWESQEEQVKDLYNYMKVITRMEGHFGVVAPNFNAHIRMMYVNEGDFHITNPRIIEHSHTLKNCTYLNHNGTISIIENRYEWLKLGFIDCSEDRYGSETNQIFKGFNSCGIESLLEDLK